MLQLSMIQVALRFVSDAVLVAIGFSQPAPALHDDNNAENLADGQANARGNLGDRQALFFPLASRWPCATATDSAACANRC